MMCPEILQGDPPASEGLRGLRLWGAGRISNCTFSDTLASSLVASSKEQCSVLVPSMDRMWSPACSAPLLARCGERGGGKLTWVASPPASPLHYGGARHVPHLSTTLAGLMRSMVMTGLFRWEPVVSEIPRADPGILVISTIKGPEALATVSGTWNERTV